MPLCDIERTGDWPKGKLTGALVVAPSEKKALESIAHLVKDEEELKLFKANRVPTTGVKLLWTGWGE